MLVALNDIDQSAGNDEMLRISDVETGVGESIGSLGDGFVESEAMAVLPAGSQPPGFASQTLADRVFVVDNDRLVELDPWTGHGTEIGPIYFAGVSGIAFHPETQELCGVTYGTNRLLHFDLMSGAGTQLAGDVLDGRRLEDLAFHPDGRAFLLTSGPRVYQINVATG